MTTTKPPQDPKTAYPTPPFPKQQQEPPGTEDELQPRADHGEETYRGVGRLTDRVAVITGGDSGIGKAVAIAFAREGADVVVNYLVSRKRPTHRTPSAGSPTPGGKRSRFRATFGRRSSAER